jgi:thioesterase domain-containing protein
LTENGEKVTFLGMIDSIRPGYYKRSPFLIRVFLHLNNIFRRGPAYLLLFKLQLVPQGVPHRADADSVLGGIAGLICRVL